jgi:hypothetical protein
MNTEHYKAASERTDENERLLIPAIRKPQPYDHDKEAEESLHAELKSLRAHKARLDRELHEMRQVNQQQMAFFQDALAFIRENDGNHNLTLATLVHDISGIARDERCFLPRVSGYAAREKVT